MGLKRGDMKKYIRVAQFAPYMGLKSELKQQAYNMITFAPYMGLKRFANDLPTEVK